MSPLGAIAQGGAPASLGGSVSDAVLWVGVSIVVFIGAVFLLLRVRKLFLADDEEGGEGDIVSLHTLRQMRDEGTLSEEEYKKAAGVLLKASPGSNPIRDEIERRARERDAPPS